jgi:uncharacterized repeat protein (TIGR04138 family)
MQRRQFEEALTQILIEIPAYPAEAYLFLREVLEFTNSSLKKPARGPARHITGQELCDGMRRYALQEYGPIARTVLASFGIKRTEDLGELVYNLVNYGFLGKTDEDRKSDFANGYDFHEAFNLPFLPSSKKTPPPEAKAAPRRRSKQSQPSISHE